ncbi:MAG: hypothetical protein HOQ35_13255 [Acidobacteriaceae bacterium]|nr:hypothetical protein [Acidobacteriaceae bacterium]
MPPQPSPNYSQPKIRQIVLEAIFRHERLFWLTIAGIMLLVAVGTYLTPKKYQADAKLMVQNVRSSSPLTTTASDRLVTSGTVSAEQISTQVELLQSPAVALRAIGAGPAGSVSREKNREAEKLGKALSVEAVHQTNLIELKLLGDSPEQAADQLRRVIDAYFTERAGSGLSAGAASFFDEQLRFKQRQLQVDQELLSDFQVKHGISDLDEEKKLQTERISSLINQSLLAQTQLAAQRSRAETNRRQLVLTPARSSTIQRSITNQYSQEHLGTELVDLQNHLTELQKRYPENDRQVIETKEKIETVKKAEAGARSAPATEESTDVNPIYQQLSASLAASAGEMSAGAAEVAKINEQLEDARHRLEELNVATSQYDALKRDVAEAQRDFDVYAQKRDEARVSEELDKARMFDVSVVQPPISQSNQIRPRPKLYMAAGLVFGFLLATLLAIYVDTSSEMVYLPSQLDGLTGVRTVATVAEDDQANASSANAIAYRRILLAIRNALRHREQEIVAQTKGLLGGPTPENTAPGQNEPAEPMSYGRCIAFVSPLQGEGVTYIVNHLAGEAARQASFRVVVIDAALLLRQFAEKGDAGFALKKDKRAGYWELDTTIEVPDSKNHIPRGTSLQEVFSLRLRPMMAQLRLDFDYVLLDCPSLAESTLSGELDRVVDGYVGVVGAGYSRKQNIQGMAAMFEEASAPVLGYVLTRRRYPVPTWLHRLI